MLLRKYISLFLLMLLFSASVLAQETKKDVDNLTRNEVLEMNIEELSDYDLEEIMILMDIVGASSIEELYELLLNKDVTSASKSEESVFDSPLSTTVLSHDQIISSGATSIEEALRLVPGIIVREKTNGNYDVHIRGNDNLPSKNMILYSENANTLVMINGRPVFNYSHGGTLWETLPVSFVDIDRIEVVRGPSSALYGPNAVSGVINIITQNTTKDTPLLSGNAQVGNLNTYIGDIAFRKQLNDKVSMGITGNYEIRDRETDKIYVYNGKTSDGNNKYMLDGNRVSNGYYSTDEIRRLKLIPELGGFELWPDINEYDIYNIDDIFPDADQSRKRLGVNGYIDFSPTTDINFNISGGYQNSNVMTSSMGDNPTPYSQKSSSTAYIDVRGDIKNLSIQANYNGGTTDYMLGNEGFELDMKQITAQVEYNFKLNKIDIRPGVNYQSISYDDSKHISKPGRGYLNQKRTIEISAANVRFDYKPIDKVRLIAALRAEKYNSSENIYPSWQFIGSYKLNDNHILRGVYSRANQSAFLVNTYADFLWETNRPYPRVMHFDSNSDYDLKTMDMFEIGYRIRPSKSMLIDIEGFYNISKNYGALMPDYVSLDINNPLGILTADQAPVVLPDSVHMQYKDLNMKSKQLGVSVNIDWVINEKLIANAHLTVQQTKLDNYLAYSRDDVIGYLANDAATNTTQTDAATAQLQALGYGLMTGSITPSDVPASIFYAGSSNFPTDTKSNYDHKATPSYFGGFSLTYRPTKKIEIFPQAYFYGDQTFENQYDVVKIDSKFLLNTKVSYKATDNLTFYVNGRNILNQRSVEFAFMDKTPMMILGGLHFKF